MKHIELRLSFGVDQTPVIMKLVYDAMNEGWMEDYHMESGPEKNHYTFTFKDVSCVYLFGFRQARLTPYEVLSALTQSITPKPDNDENT